MAARPPALVPDGIDPLDEQEARRAALNCMNAVAQLLKSAKLHRGGTEVTEKAILRCLYDVDRAVAHAENFHYCGHALFSVPRNLPCLYATKFTKAVRTRCINAVVEWNNRTETCSEEWSCLWDLYQQHFGCAVGPTWGDSEVCIEMSDADEHGLINTAAFTFPQVVQERRWHFGAWPFLCEKLAPFDDEDFDGLIHALLAMDAPPESPHDSPMCGLDANKTDPPASSKPKRRGRPKADYATVQLEAKLAADWERARGAEVYKPDFAKQKGMTVVELDLVLDRVAARKRRADK